MSAPLTIKQQLFCKYYLETLNATEAARRAGYKGNENTLANVGSDNIRKPKIRAYIDEQLAALTMSADEVLFSLDKIARGADITQFADLVQLYTQDEDGNIYPTDLALKVDLEKIQKAGAGHLIKRLSQNAKGGLTIEWHDPQRALELLGKRYKLFSDRAEIDITTGGKPLNLDQTDRDRSILALSETIGDILSQQVDSEPGDVDPAE